MPLVILTEDQQVTYTLYMYSSISFVHDAVEHQHFVFSFYLFIDFKSSIYNIEVDLGVASLLDTVIRLNHLWNLHLHMNYFSKCLVIWKKNMTTLKYDGCFPLSDFYDEPFMPFTWQILQLLFPKLLFFPPKKWMNSISNQLSIALIKYVNWPSPVFGWFQNRCYKVVIEPHVVQFWSEIILVWFWNNAYDFSPNCTPLGSITIIFPCTVMFDSSVILCGETKS